MILFAGVVLGLVLRGMSSEERLRFGRTILAGLWFVKNAIAKPPAGGEAFYTALKARTRWAPVTPAILVVYLTVFVLQVLSGAEVGDAKSLVEWGGSIGPRTTNGDWWRLGAAMFVHMGLIHLIAETAGLVPLIMESMENGVETATRFFEELQYARKDRRRSA